jgi:hypothetical protein
LRELRKINSGIGSEGEEQNQPDRETFLIATGLPTVEEHAQSAAIHRSVVRLNKIFTAKTFTGGNRL